MVLAVVLQKPPSVLVPVLLMGFKVGFIIYFIDYAYSSFPPPPSRPYPFSLCSCFSWWYSSMISCLHPVKIFCSHPVTGESNVCYVPCGRCVCCVNSRVNEWRYRLRQELKYSLNGCFATLTVDPEHMDSVHNDPKGVFQKFIKRFRKNCPYDLRSVGFKYFCVSELGHEKGRLHYHVLFFNYLHDFWSLQKYISQTWQQGNVFIEPITEKRIDYCTKYMLNSMFNSFGKHTYETVRKYNRRFNTFSEIKVRKYHKPFSWYFSLKSQGIGYSCLTKEFLWYLLRNSFVVKVPNSKGKLCEFSLPRTLYKRACTLLPFLNINEVKSVRYEKMVENSADYIRSIDANSKLYIQECTGEFADLSSAERESLSARRRIILRSQQLLKTIFTKMNFKVPPLSPFDVPPRYKLISQP